MAGTKQKPILARFNITTGDIMSIPFIDTAKLSFDDFLDPAKALELLGDREILEVDLEGSTEPVIPGVYSGPWEDSYPSEGGSVDQLEISFMKDDIKVCIEETWLTPRVLLEICDKMSEKHSMTLREIHDADKEPDYDEQYERDMEYADNVIDRLLDEKYR